MNGQLCLLYYQWLNHQVVILKLCGEAAGSCLGMAPFRFPVLQVFPDLPDNPAVLKLMVMLRRLVFPSHGKAVSISLQQLQF